MVIMEFICVILLTLFFLKLIEFVLRGSAGFGFLRATMEKVFQNVSIENQRDSELLNPYASGSSNSPASLVKRRSSADPEATESSSHAFNMPVKVEEDGIPEPSGTCRSGNLGEVWTSRSKGSSSSSPDKDSPPIVRYSAEYDREFPPLVPRNNERSSPVDDGIRVSLPRAPEEMNPSTENVGDDDAYIWQVLYGPSTRKRLPVFKEFCPDSSDEDE